MWDTHCVFDVFSPSRRSEGPDDGDADGKREKRESLRPQTFFRNSSASKLRLTTLGLSTWIPLALDFPLCCVPFNPTMHLSVEISALSNGFAVIVSRVYNTMGI